MRQPRPSTVKLPARPPEGVRTLLDFFVRRFPRITRETWEERFREGKVFSDEGPLRADDPYTPLLEARYYREVEREAPVRTDWRIVHEDRDLLVVDKPPFLPVTPAGAYLRNCLLNLLVEGAGNEELAPLHRIDKDTSGLTLFSKRLASRSHFSRLFLNAESHLEKEYLAVCHASRPVPEAPFRLEHHLARCEETYPLDAVVEGRPANAVCDVEPLETEAGRVLFRIKPLTGRRHQLRIQLSHEGFPIVNDRLYGLAPRHDPEDLSDPLLLVCRRLAVRDWPVFEGEGILSDEWSSAYKLSADASAPE